MAFCERCGLETEKTIRLIKSVKSLGSAAELFETDKLADVMLVAADCEDICPDCAVLEERDVPAEIRQRVQYYVSLMAHSVDQHRPEGAVQVPKESAPSEKERVPDVLIEALADAVLRELGLE